MLTLAGGITPALRALLEDPTVAKTGVNARGDAHKVMRDFRIAVAGVVELRDLAAERVPLPTADNNNTNNNSRASHQSPCQLNPSTLKGQLEWLQGHHTHLRGST